MTPDLMQLVVWLLVVFVGILYVLLFVSLPIFSKVSRLSKRVHIFDDMNNRGDFTVVFDTDRERAYKQYLSMQRNKNEGNCVSAEIDPKIDGKPV